jgi:polyferredoxin
MNLENRHWCHHACPIGTTHDCQSRLSRHARTIPRVAWLSALGGLLFTIVAYFKVENDLTADGILNGSWYLQFFSNSFSANAIVICVVIVFFVVGFFYRRPFCTTLCPLGNTSELILRGERWVLDATKTRSLSENGIAKQDLDNGTSNG